MTWEKKYYPEFWDGKKLAYPHVAKESPKFARSIVLGNFIFVSGCTGQDTIEGNPTSDFFAEQMTMALRKIKMALEETGSEMNNIIKTTILLKNVDDYATMRTIETDFYLENAPHLIKEPPASTLICPAGLAKEEFLVEIEVIAVRERHKEECKVQSYKEIWGGKVLSYPSVPKEHPKFARSEVVGNLIFVSGCEALNHDTLKVDTNDIQAQVMICLEKTKIGMEQAGSSIDNIVKTNILLRDINHYASYRKAEKAYFEKNAPMLAQNPPASAVFNTNFAHPDFLVEIESFGVLDRDLPGWNVKYNEGNEEAAGSVSVGKLLFLSGLDGSDTQTGKVEKDDIEAQITVALDKVRLELEKAGGC